MTKTAATTTETITLHELVKRGQNLVAYLVSKWWIILLAGCLGGACGLIYAFLKPPTYKANLTFLVEEGKSGGGGLASIAGQFGFDLGGLGGTNGLLSGDNILVFLKSVSLAKEALLTPYDSTATMSLADKYATVNGLRKKWKEDARIGKEVFFPAGPNRSFSRLQDSLLQEIVSRILKKELVVERPDKKASFVQVTAEMRDELLAKYFCERLVKGATDRYITSKTSRQAINVNKLQRRADSIGNLLNRKTFATAAAQGQLLDLNPAFKTATVNAEVTGRDKVMLTTIYGEVIKNLEISKVALSQETPAIQIVDGVDFPLKVNETKKGIATVLGIIAGTFISILVLALVMLAKINLLPGGKRNWEN